MLQISTYIVDSERPGATGALWSARNRSLVPVCAAECCSWCGASGNSRFFCAEYCLWCLGTRLELGCGRALHLSAARRRRDAQRRAARRARPPPQPRTKFRTSSSPRSPRTSRRRRRSAAWECRGSAAVGSAAALLLHLLLRLLVVVDVRRGALLDARRGGVIGALWSFRRLETAARSSISVPHRRRKILRLSPIKKSGRTSSVKNLNAKSPYALKSQKRARSVRVDAFVRTASASQEPKTARCGWSIRSRRAASTSSSTATTSTRFRWTS